jgi:peptidoglycan hydrolase-like protein with peptidoglycan-binding domain
MAQKKILPYLLFGIPLLVGGYFILRSFKKPKDTTTPPKEGGNEGGGTQGGGTQGGGSTTPSSDPNKLPFKKGSKGMYVSTLQSKLSDLGYKDSKGNKLSPDGDFGSKTEFSVKAFQRAKGLVADGIVGAKTWKAMFGGDFPYTGGILSTTNTPLTKVPKFANTKFALNEFEY